MNSCPVIQEVNKNRSKLNYYCITCGRRIFFFYFGRDFIYQKYVGPNLNSLSRRRICNCRFVNKIWNSICK